MAVILTGLISGNALKPVYATKSKPVDEKTVSATGKAALDLKISGEEADGWRVVRSNKSSVRLCKRIFGNEAKTVLIEDDIALSAPIRAKVIDSRHVGLQLAGKPVLKTGALTREAAGLLLGDMDAVLSRELTKALDAESARASFPAIEGTDGSFESAGFVPGSPSLRLAVAGTVRMTAAALGTILAKYGRKEGK